MKDVQPSKHDRTLRLTDTLLGQYGGPPGKLYVPDVLQHVKTGGSSARVVVDEDGTAVHGILFDKLRDELETGKIVRDLSFAIIDSLLIFVVFVTAF